MIELMKCAVNLVPILSSLGKELSIRVVGGKVPIAKMSYGTVKIVTTIKKVINRNK